MKPKQEETRKTIFKTVTWGSIMFVNQIWTEIRKWNELLLIKLHYLYSPHYYDDDNIIIIIIVVIIYSYLCIARKSLHNINQFRNNDGNFSSLPCHFAYILSKLTFLLILKCDFSLSASNRNAQMTFPFSVIV